MGNIIDFHVKLDRARSHLDDLKIQIPNWFGKDRYTLIPEKDPQGGPNDWQIRMYADLPPPEWSAIVGDVLHNLRGTLDHLVFSLSSSYSPHPLTKEITEKSEFPIYGDVRSEGVAAVEQRYRWDFAKKLSGVPPEAKAFIQSLQPYLTGSDYIHSPLWQLHELSNIDKHRLLLVCALNCKSTVLNPFPKNFDFTGAQAIYDARLDRDAVIMRFSGRQRDPNKGMDVKFDPLIDVIFNRVPTVDGKDVIKSLDGIYKYVRNTVIPPLERFV